MSKTRLSRLSTGIAGVVMSALLVSAAWGYEAIEVKNGGQITGEVKLVGNAPTPAKLVVTKDTAVCAKTPKVNEALLVGPNKGIKNVVVSIANMEKGKKMGKGGTLDQRGCIYTPHVVLSPARTELTIINSDGILHNIHTFSAKNPSLNKAQPKFKKTMKEKFAQPEIIKLTCDAHSWMSGWLVVQEHPYYAVTDATGAFTLTDVPPGDYELRFWHETLGEMAQKVSVKANQTTKVPITVTKP